MASIIGFGINQIPTNGMLGGLAFQDPNYVSISLIQSSNAGTQNGNLILNPVSGNIGIGTTATTTKLEVNGGVRISGVTTVTNTTSATSTTTGALQIVGGAGIGGNLFVGGNLNISGTISGTLTGNAATVSTIQRVTTATHFLTFVDSNNPSDTAEIIYTTSSFVIQPSSGNVSTKGNLTIENGALGGGTQRNPGLRLWTDNAFGSELHFGTGSQSPSWATAIFGRNSDTVALRFGSYPGSSGNQNQFIELMTLFNNGNLGIGTTSTSARLHVAGGGAWINNSSGDTQTRAQGLTVSMAPSADWPVGSDPGDGRRNASFISASSGTRAVVVSLRNTLNNNAFWDLIADPVTSRFYIQSVSSGFSAFNISTAGVVSISTITNASSTTTGALVVTGGAGIGGNLYVGEDLRSKGFRTAQVVCNLNAALNSTTEIGNWSINNGAHNLHITVTASLAGYSVSKSYLLSTFFNQGSGSWFTVGPLSNPGPYTDDFSLEAAQINTILYLRLRKTIGSTLGGNHQVTMLNVGEQTDVFTPTTVTGTWTTATSLLSSTPIAVGPNYASINQSTQTSGAALTVNGGVFVNGVVTATNFFGNIIGNAASVSTIQRTTNASHFLTFVDSNNSSTTAENVYTTSSFVINPVTGNVGLGTTNPTVTLDVRGVIQGQAYTIPDTGALAQWMRLGTLTIPQLGYTAKIRAYIHAGFNATNDQDFYVDIFFKTSNNSSVDSNGFAANSWYYSIGNNTHDVTPKWVGNNTGTTATSYDLFLNLPVFTANSHYVVEMVRGVTWTHVGAVGVSAPGADSATTETSALSYNIPIGNVGIGTVTPTSKLHIVGDARITGITTLTNTTAATLPTTGALQVAGGVGIGGALWVENSIFAKGGAIEIREDTTASIILASLQQQGAGVVFELGRIDGIAISPAIDFHSSGANIDFDSRIVSVGGSTSTTGQARLDLIANQVYLSSNQSATSTQTGALRVVGGVGIGGNLYVGGEIVAQRLTIELTTVTTTLVQTDDIIQTSNTTNATNTTTGALIVAGGVGIGKDLRVGGTIYGTIVGTLTGNAATVSTVQQLSTSAHFLTFVDSNNSGATAENVYTTSSFTVIPSSGNIGIGTDNPVEKLQIVGNYISLRNLTNNAAGLVLDSGSTITQNTQIFLRDIGVDRWTIRKNSANNFDIFGNSLGSTALVITTSNNNVLVGSLSSSIARKFTVVGEGNFTDASNITRLYLGYGTIPIAGGTGAYVFNADNSPLALGTNNTELMRLAVQGYVSVGPVITISNTASSRLFVNGDISLPGGNRSIFGNLYYDIISSIWRYSGNGFGWGIREDNTGKVQFIRAGNNTSGTNVTATVTLSDLITLDINTNNIGIGTGSPTSKLHVVGDARITGITTVTNTTNAVSTTTGALIVAGGAGIGQDLRVGGTIFGNVSGTLTGNAATASQVNTIRQTSAATHFLTFVDSDNASATAESLFTTSTVYAVPSNGQLWAAQLRQTGNNVAIGNSAGNVNQGTSAVAIGVNAGQNTQTQFAVAIGTGAGNVSQGDSSVSVGPSAGQTNQGVSAVAIGVQAGQSTQTSFAVAIGSGAGQTLQGDGAVAVGRWSGQTSQSSLSVAIGAQAGQTSQGSNAVAIGNIAGQTNQPANSIMLNASGSALNGTNAGFYVNPVRADATTSATSNLVYYNPATRELTTGTITAFGGNSASVSTVQRTTNATHFLTFVDSNNTSTTAESVYTTSSFVINPSTGNVGIGAASPSFKLEVNGSFAATTKSFVIPHPTKPGMKLRYGSLEGPENGIYIRGKLSNSNTIELPDYWIKLIDPESITVNLTPIGRHQNLYVEEIADNKVIIGNSNLLNKEINCFYIVFAERKDVDKLQVEIY